MTTNRIRRNCDKFLEVCGTPTSIYTEYKDTTIYIHDTITIKLPPDTVKIKELVSVNNGIASMQPIHKSFGLISTDAWIVNSNLEINSYLNDSTFIKIDTKKIDINNAIKTTTKKEFIRQKYIPQLYKYALYGWIIVIIIVSIYSFLKYKIRILKTVSSATKIVSSIIKKI